LYKYNKIKGRFGKFTNIKIGVTYEIHDFDAFARFIGSVRGWQSAKLGGEFAKFRRRFGSGGYTGKFTLAGVSERRKSRDSGDSQNRNDTAERRFADESNVSV